MEQWNITIACVRHPYRNLKVILFGIIVIVIVKYALPVLWVACESPSLVMIQKGASAFIQKQRE